MIFSRKQCKRNYRFYEKELSNFKTVMKDTNNNLVTADQNDYNCMSYALGVFNDWLRIDAFKYSFVDEEYEEVDYDCLEDVFNDCCAEIEYKFAVRRLTGPTASIKENERMIAFRVGADDFHFARRNSDGIWTHKPGGNYIREMSEDELFSEAWCKRARLYPYISEIAFFAVEI
jgi:hypothetical protein